MVESPAAGVFGTRTPSCCARDPQSNPATASVDSSGDGASPHCRIHSLSRFLASLSFSAGNGVFARRPSFSIGIIFIGCRITCTGSGGHCCLICQPTAVSAFITESGATIDKRSVQSLCSILKVFFRYLYRVGLMTRDLGKAIESPRRYSFSNLPRSITWSEVEQMLQKVDRRSAVGKRDYAILLLLVTYGLRAREIGALTLDDIDWKRDHLHIRGRKAGHSTAYPLAPPVGEALLDYLKQGRPATTERAVFFRAYAPYTPLSRVAVSLRAKWYLQKAGINVPRPGSHTLRHTCVQRLVDSGFSLKTIGDFVGHRTPDATKIYAKVNVEALREVALGDGEEVL